MITYRKRNQQEQTEQTETEDTCIDGIAQSDHRLRWTIWIGESEVILLSLCYLRCLMFQSVAFRLLSLRSNLQAEKVERPIG